MYLAYLLLVTGLTISGVAIYYSVIGMAAIFSASPIPIYIMFTILEIAKLVVVSWLKANWIRAPAFMKTYMTTVILVLMMLTSMGVFGFLSKAHLDQNLVSGEVLDKVTTLDEKIKTHRENIDAARKALKQMDESVDQTVARSTSEKSVGRAVDIRRSQNKERGLLRNEIETAQKEIAKLNEERAPISKDLRKVEAEVGPIKYIATLIYGDNPSQNLLERAVTWVIIMIVIVFDPLAVVMLLAAQMTFAWLKPQLEVKTEDLPAPTIDEPKIIEIIEQPVYNEDTVVNADEVFLSDPILPIQELHIKPVDLLYNEYDKDKFAGIIVDPNKEPELAEFIEKSKEKPRFNNYSQDALKYYARRIYELRKDNNNNTSR